MTRPQGRAVEDEAAAQVAVQGVAQENGVLADQGLIQPQVGPHILHLLLGGVVGQEQLHRVAGVVKNHEKRSG